MNDHYWPPQQLADYWGMSITTLSDWRRKGIGPIFLKLGGKVVYREEDIRQYEVQCLRQSTSQAFVLEEK